MFWSNYQALTKYTRALAGCTNDRGVLYILPLETRRNPVFLAFLFELGGANMFNG